MSQYKLTIFVESPSPQEAIQNVIDQLANKCSGQFALVVSPTTTGTITSLEMEELM